MTKSNAVTTISTTIAGALLALYGVALAVNVVLGG
jgi:hypothetical protein